MAVRRLAAEQPASFAFTPENLDWIKGQVAKFPDGRQASAIIPVLWRAQDQAGGWLPEPAIRLTADMLGMPYIRALEVATFYTMFALEPVGRHFVQVCGTVPCAIKGARELRQVCERRIGREHHVGDDGLFSWLEVECLGACTNAPMVQINYDYYEDLTAESFEALLDRLEAGLPVVPGPQDGRQRSAPAGGPTTLLDAGLYDGSMVGAWRKRFEKQSETAEAAAASATMPREAAKPKKSGSGEEAASDAPADRVENGKPATPPAQRAEAADATGGAPSPSSKKES